MNSINENEIRLANLNASAEKRRAEFCDIRAKVLPQIAKVVEDAVAASGVGGYALRKNEDGELDDTDRMTLCGEIDGERLHDIDLYFRKDSWRDNDCGKRVFAVNTCCFGNVKAGDKSGVAYCVLMGHLASHLQEIQDALNAISEWDAYNLARHIWHISRDEAEAFERKLKEESESARLAEIEKRLIVGAVVATEKVRKYDFDKSQYIYTGVSTMEVERVTAKLVFFKDACRQYKKDDVCQRLLRGMDFYGWSFAEDIDMTQFPCPVEV